MTSSVPGEVIEAAVAVCGRAFHYKSSLRTIMVAAGVPEVTFARYEVEGASKYAIARNVLNDLASRGQSGQAVLRRVIADLAAMTRPDAAAPDQEAGRLAIAVLRDLAARKRVLLDVEAQEVHSRQAAQKKRLEALNARRAGLEALSARFSQLARGVVGPQKRGYEFERMLADLFALFELTYRPSYRMPHEQVDGALEYKGFTYLVEARWRTAPPDFGDLADFKGKVDGKLESTRGLFVSVAGFDQAVVDHFMGAARGTRNNLLLFSGEDLALILQDHLGLRDALDYKIGSASEEGRWWAPLARRAN